MVCGGGRRPHRLPAPTCRLWHTTPLVSAASLKPTSCVDSSMLQLRTSMRPARSEAMALRVLAREHSRAMREAPEEATSTVEEQPVMMH